MTDGKKVRNVRNIRMDKSLEIIKQTEEYKKFEFHFLPLVVSGMKKEKLLQKEVKREEIQELLLAVFNLMTYAFKCGSKYRQNYYTTWSGRLKHYRFYDFLMEEQKYESIVGDKFEQRDLIRWAFIRNEKVKELYNNWDSLIDYEIKRGQTLKEIITDIRSLDISFGWE